MEPNPRVIVQFVSVDGARTGGQLEVDAAVDSASLNTIVNSLLENDEPLPYSFSVDGLPVAKTLSDSIRETGASTEQTLEIVYTPEDIFRVRAVTRCSSSLSGHTEAVLVVSFNPQSNLLASGSGDTTIRIWDIFTATSKMTLKGHRNWVLSLSWSPDGKYLASGGMDNEVRIWKLGNSVGGDGDDQLAQPQSGGPPAESTEGSFRVLKGHRKWITALAWEPLHLKSPSRHLASSSKDFTVKIWDVPTGRCLRTLSGHTLSVTCLKWTGDDLIVTGSQDRLIKVFEASTGKLCRTLKGHAHWVNCLSLNTETVLRTGAMEVGRTQSDDAETERKHALDRYERVTKGKGEVLASGSDDFTIRLWLPSTSNKPVAIITGHSKPVNSVLFSPNGRYISSASFDSFVKLWDGATGKFICNFRGHVGAVYMLCWSSDSRLLVTASKDSTLKLWDVGRKRQKLDLPGHADEVFAVDWSVDGEYVASGSKDKLVKIWRS